MTELKRTMSMLRRRLRQAICVGNEGVRRGGIGK